MSKPLVLLDIPAKLVHVQHVKIVIPPDTFQQHLPNTFSQPKVGEMEIDKTPPQIRVQNLHIASRTILKKNNWPRSIWVLKKTCNMLKLV